MVFRRDLTICDIVMRQEGSVFLLVNSSHCRVRWSWIIIMLGHREYVYIGFTLVYPREIFRRIDFAVFAVSDDGV